MPQASWELVGLTTVHQPTIDMARTAARLLVRRIEGEATPGGVQREIFEPRLVLRRTLGPPVPSSEWPRSASSTVARAA